MPIYYCIPMQQHRDTADLPWSDSFNIISLCCLVNQGLLEDMAATMRRFANSVGADSSKLTVRGTLHKGVAKSATASSANAPIWFAFSGAPSLLNNLLF